jgi:tetratricopeptide (TPR) repeat protein
MTARAAIFLALAAALIVVPTTAPGGELRERADALWSERSDPEKAKEALTAYEALLAEHPGDGDLLVRIARLAYWIGRNIEEKNRAEGIVYYERAEGYGRRASAAAPGQAGGYYFMAASIARRLDLKADISIVLEVRGIRKLNENAATRDPGFFYGGPDRLFCYFYTNLPGLIGGSTGKAIEHGRRAVAAFPDYAGNRVALAEAYHRDGNNLMALQELEAALATPDDAIPDTVPEQRFEKRKAEALYRKIGK